MNVKNVKFVKLYYPNVIQLTEDPKYFPRGRHIGQVWVKFKAILCQIPSLFHSTCIHKSLSKFMSPSNKQNVVEERLASYSGSSRLKSRTATRKFWMGCRGFPQSVYKDTAAGRKIRILRFFP